MVVCNGDMVIYPIAYTIAVAGRSGKIWRAAAPLEGHRIVGMV